MSLKRITAVILVAMAASVSFSERAAARVRLENICTIYGQREIKLVGIGLVVGLNGTGDGGKNLPAMRALAQVMKLMNSPVADVNELRNAKNVAIVHIEATIPRSGLRYGQKIDCYVSSAMGAKSLRNGRLLATPVEEADIANDRVAGLASGGIRLEDPQALTTGKIPGGLVLHRNFPVRFIQKRKTGSYITLLLDEGHSSFYSASEVARVVNEEFSSESDRNEFGKRRLIRVLEPGLTVATAVAPGVVEVILPPVYEKSPVEFVATVLDVGIDHPHTQARVVVNAKTGTVIVTGEVEISPVLISKNGLRIEIQAAAGAPRGGFVELKDRRNPESSQQLKLLVESLNELRVPTKDIIEIIRELHKSGKLHAEYVER